MEEIDEVGEVDMGFDLASWMSEDFSEEQAKDNLTSTTEASKASPGSCIQNTKIQQPCAPMTPTMRKVLGVAEDVKKPTIGTNKSEKQASADATKTKTSGISTFSKLADSASTPPSEKLGAQGKVNPVKSGEEKGKLGQSPEPAILRAKTVHEATIKILSTSAKITTVTQKGKVQKKPVAKIPESDGTPKNVKPATEEKKINPQPVTRAQTRSSTQSLRASKTIAVKKKPDTSTKTATKPPTGNVAVSPSPVANLKSPNKQMKTNSPTLSVSRNKNLTASSESSLQLKTPQQLKAEQAITMQQIKPAASVTKQNTIIKSVEEVTATVPSEKMDGSQPGTIFIYSSASSIVENTTCTAERICSAEQESENMTQNQTPIKKVSSPADKISQASVGKVSASENISFSADLAKSTISSAISSGAGTSSATKALTKATPAKKASVMSTTEVKVSKPPAVAVSGVAPKLLSTMTNSSRETQTKSTASTATDLKSNAQTTPASRVSLVAVSGSNKVSSAALSFLSSTQTISKSDSINILPSTTADPISTEHTVPVNENPLLPTPPSHKAATIPSVVARGPKSSTIATQSTTPTLSVVKKVPITTASATITSLSCIKSLNKSESLKRKDNTSSRSFIADVMSRQEAFEDMDLGLTMSMEDVFDSTIISRVTVQDDDKKTVVSNKRPVSAACDGPPSKQIKSEGVSPKAAGLLKIKDKFIKGTFNDNESKLSTSPNAAGCKIDTLVLKQMKIERDQGEKQIKTEQEQKRIEKKQEEKQMKRIEEGKEIKKNQMRQQSEEKPSLHQIKPVPKITQLSTSNDSKTLSKPVKRIVRRFHRGSQTLPKESSNKLLQCLIRIPALDNPPKSTSSVSVSATLSSESEDKKTPFYMSPLAPTVQQNVLDSVLLFNINQMENRRIKSKAFFTHGISIGHVTQAEMDKSLFRENIVSKSSYYSFQFNGQDGVMDLYFTNEEPYLAVMTQIRKTKIGPRYLPVTFFKVLPKEDQDSDCPQPYVRATVVFDQNFASSAFLGYAKAQIWNKPKLEETFSVHNMPGGIPMDFLRQLIPDAITIDVEDESHKFTQQGRRVLLGINRKTGDHILKLFHQLYVNRHCIALARGRTTAANTPELKEILEKQNNEGKDQMPGKTLRTRARNINSRSNQENQKKTSRIDDGAEVVMQVDDVPDADRMLVGRAAAWTGPSTVAQLRQAQLTPVLAGDIYSKSLPVPHQGSALQGLSHISDNLSDISDNSDIGEGHDEQTTLLSTGKVSRPTSVRSFDRDSQGLAKDTKTKNSRGPHSASSREVSESGDSKTRRVKDLDAFGRSRDIRYKFKSSELEQKTALTSWSGNEHEKQRLGQGDLRHFMTGPSDAGHSGQGNPRKEISPDQVVDRDRLSKYSRYSPETEWLLVNRDKERARYMKRGRSPSPQLDSRDRFKRLVEEKMRGLEDFVRGSSLQEQTGDEKSFKPRQQRYSRERDSDKKRALPPKRKYRSRSPSDRHVRRERSASPVVRIRGITRKELMTGKESEETGHKKASPPPFNLSGRRIMLSRRKSVSPLHKDGAGRGCTSLSPIRIDDDDDKEGGTDRVRERRERKQPEYNYRRPTPLQSHRDASAKERYQTDPVRTNMGTEEHNKEVSEPASHAAPVSPTDDLEDSTSAEREILHEFVKHLLERANITEADGSSFASNPTTHQAENKMSSNVHHRQPEECWSSDQPKTVHSKEQTGPSNLIPPPIPPPIMPPLFTPDPETEKISQLESLAKQLAADIQRQMPQESQQESQVPPQQQQLSQSQRPPQVQQQLQGRPQVQQQLQGPPQVQQQLQRPPQVQQQLQGPPQVQQQQQQYQQQMFTQTFHAPSYPHTSQAQAYLQHTSKASGGLLPRPMLSVPLNQPPPPVIHTTMPPPQMMVATAPPPMGILGQPAVPLPFFSTMTTPVRLQTLSSMGQSQGQNNNNNGADVQLNRDGTFF